MSIAGKHIKQKVRGIPIRLLITAGIFLVSVFLFGLIANEMVIENENQLDKVVFHALNSITSPAMTAFMTAITFFGSTYFLFPAYSLLILYMLFFKKDRQVSLNVAAVGITSAIILFTLKFIFHRLRPLDPLIKKVNGFSFPSGHSFSSFTFFGLLIYIVWNKELDPALQWAAIVFFFLFACAIAFSRVYLHVHYASDVVAGFFLCLVWLGLSIWLLPKMDTWLAKHSRA